MHLAVLACMHAFILHACMRSFMDACMHAAFMQTRVHKVCVNIFVTMKGCVSSCTARQQIMDKSCHACWLTVVLPAESKAAMRCGMFVADVREGCCEEAAYSVHKLAG